MRRPQQPHEELEQELRTLEEQCTTGDAGGDGPDENIKKRVRSIKNCLAAKKSREQARSYVQELEKKMSSLEQQNADLARRLAIAEAENDAFKRGLKRPAENCPEEQENREGEPAVLPSSLQLDAVLIMSFMVACLLGSTEASEGSFRTMWGLALGGCLPAPQRHKGVRCSLRSLRRAGFLEAMSHLGRRAPAA